MGLNVEQPEKTNWVYFVRLFACLFCTSILHVYLHFYFARVFACLSRTSICTSILHLYFARLFGIQLMVHKWLLGHLGPSSPTWASNFSCYLFYSWFLPENIKQAKGIECSQYKTRAASSPSSLAICPVCFHLAMPMQALSSCYAGYGHTRGMKRYVIYSLAFYVRLQVQILSYYMRFTTAKNSWVSLEKI